MDLLLMTADTIRCRMQQWQQSQSNDGDICNALLQFPTINVGEYSTLSGKWINGYSYGKPEQLVQTLYRVINECSQMGYIKRAYPLLQFKPVAEQAAFNSEQTKAIEEQSQWITNNKDNILRQHKGNGMEGEY